MTASRIVRGTRARIFIYICAVLFTIGIIACYNNTRIQLDNVEKTLDLCKLQQENLSTQMQVIFDYKQRLEKTLTSEKSEHQKAKTNFESKLAEERERSGKKVKEQDLRYTKLQQHYTILQAEFEDFKDDCSKVQHKQLNDINQLHSKQKEIQDQSQRLDNDKDKELEQVKVENALLNHELDKLRDQLMLSQDKYHKKGQTISNLAKSVQKLDLRHRVSFYEQVQTTKDSYQVNISRPNISENSSKSNYNVGIEANNVLPVPIVKYIQRSSTSTSNSIKQEGPALLKIPNVTPATGRKKTPEESKNVAIAHSRSKLPNGVVPIPVLEDDGDNIGIEMNAMDHSKSNGQQHQLDTAINVDDNLNDEFDPVLNNRYRGNIINYAHNLDAREADNGIDEAVKIEENEKENSAHELFGNIEGLGGNNENGMLPLLDGVVEKVLKDNKANDGALAEDTMGNEDDAQLNDLNLEQNGDDDPDGFHIKEAAVRD